jgi:hypothetical protein
MKAVFFAALLAQIAANAVVAAPLAKAEVIPVIE